MKTARSFLYAWILIALGFFLWQNTSAVGVANRLREWQHGDFVRFWPSTTLLGLVLIASLPALLLFLFYRLRRERSAQPDKPNPVAFADRYLKLLLTAASVAAGGAVISLLLLFTLPSSSGQVVDLRSTDIVSPRLPTGHTKLDGLSAAGPEIRYTTHLLWTSRTVRYVPVAEAGRQGIRLFVQVDDSGLVPSSVTGVTERDALPPSVRNLFIAQGILAPGSHYVLFSRPAELTRPYLLAAGQFSMVGLLLLLAALWQRKNVRSAREGERAISAAAEPTGEPESI